MRGLPATTVIFGLLVVGIAAGCEPSAATTAPAELDRLLTCEGDLVFPASALSAPPGAESGYGPEFDALRDGLARVGADEPGFLPATGWRLVARDGGSTLFLADAAAAGPPDWRSVTVRRDGGSWSWAGGGGCTPRVVLGPGIGSAEWALDPAFAAPGPTDTTLHVLVRERACASGREATGRIVGPEIAEGPDAVTITFGVRPLEGGLQTCPSNPPTPLVVALSGPLGDRQLLDGGRFPAMPPEAPS